MPSSPYTRLATGSSRSASRSARPPSTRSATLLGRGHNRRVQQGDASIHAETDAFRKAGRRRGLPQLRDGDYLVTLLVPPRPGAPVQHRPVVWLIRRGPEFHQGVTTLAGQLRRRGGRPGRPGLRVDPRGVFIADAVPPASGTRTSGSSQRTPRRAEEAVAGVPQARGDVADVVELLVERGRDDARAGGVATTPGRRRGAPRRSGRATVTSRAPRASSHGQHAVPSEPPVASMGSQTTPTWAAVEAVGQAPSR